MTRAILGTALGLLAGSGVLLALAAVLHPLPRRRPEGWARRLLREADLTRVRPGRLLAVSVLLGLVAGLVALSVTAVPVAALLAAGVGTVTPLLLVRRRAAARRQALRRDWPDAVDVLVSGVRAGMSLPEAVAALGSRGPESLRPAFSDFAVEYRATGSFADSLSLLEERLADPVADRVVGAMRMAREFGGTQLGEMLRTLSGMLREDARTRAEIAGRQSWTVAAARMAVAAPWLTLALLCTRPEAVRAYASGAGAMVLCSAVALSVAAYAVMLRIGRLPAERRVRP